MTFTAINKRVSMQHADVGRVLNLVKFGQYNFDKFLSIFIKEVDRKSQN